MQSSALRNFAVNFKHSVETHKNGPFLGVTTMIQTKRHTFWLSRSWKNHEEQGRVREGEGGEGEKKPAKSFKIKLPTSKPAFQKNTHTI